MAASGDSLSIGYGDARIQARGFTSVLIMTLVVSAGFFYYTHIQTNLERRNEHRSVMEELQVITYILSQPEGKRPVLAMPKSLQLRLQKSFYSTE